MKRVEREVVGDTIAVLCESGESRDEVEGIGEESGGGRRYVTAIRCGFHEL